MDFILSLFFILIVIIFSGVLRTLVSKSINKRIDENSDDNDFPTFNDNTYVEDENNEEQISKKETIHDLVDLFQEYSLKKKDEIQSKNSFYNKYTPQYYDEQKVKKIKEKQKKKINKIEIVQPENRELLKSLNNIYEQEDLTASDKKADALERIKKLSYLKQAVILSEILGPPKGLDF